MCVMGSGLSGASRIGRGSGCPGVVGEHTDPHCGHARGVFMTAFMNLHQDKPCGIWIGL